jgi:hypothetical protein
MGAETIKEHSSNAKINEPETEEGIYVQLYGNN